MARTFKIFLPTVVKMLLETKTLSSLLKSLSFFSFLNLRLTNMHKL